MRGLPVILAGDFRQTLHIIRRGTRTDEIETCLKLSRAIWPHVQVIHLTTNMRVHMHDDPFDSDTLIRIGQGQIPTDPTTGLIDIPYEHTVDFPQESQDKVFPDLANNFSDTSWTSERAILAPTDEVVDSINQPLLDLLPSPAQYLSIDSTDDVDAALQFPVEFLNSLKPSGLPPHDLTLKVGCPVILLRNLDAPRLCNGTYRSTTPTQCHRSHHCTWAVRRRNRLYTTNPSTI